MKPGWQKRQKAGLTLLSPAFLFFLETRLSVAATPIAATERTGCCCLRGGELGVLAHFKRMEGEHNVFALIMLGLPKLATVVSILLKQLL